jgi:hypothetical protein
LDIVRRTTSGFGFDRVVDADRDRMPAAHDHPRFRRWFPGGYRVTRWPARCAQCNTWRPLTPDARAMPSGARGSRPATAPGVSGLTGSRLCHVPSRLARPSRTRRPCPGRHGVRRLSAPLGLKPEFSYFCLRR